MSKFLSKSIVAKFVTCPGSKIRSPVLSHTCACWSVGAKESIPLDSGRDRFNWSSGAWRAFIKQCREGTISLRTVSPVVLSVYKLLNKYFFK